MELPESWNHTLRSLVGTALPGGYRIESLLGVGGMGAVYLGTTRSGDRIAVKVLRPELREDEEAFLRFEREAMATASLSHPHVVRVLHFDATVPFIVMEYIDGRPLHELLARDAPFTIERSIGLCRQVLAGLQAAHDLGVLHRDLKPGNVMVVGSPERAVVVDFGMVKLTRSLDQRRLTATGIVVGTPAYMAPEQFRADPVGPTADVWASGVLLHAMLTGQRPFGSAKDGELVRRVLTEPAPRIDRADASPALQRALDSALAKDPAKRFQSCQEFSDALGQVLISGQAEHQPTSKGVVSEPQRVARTHAHAVHETARHDRHPAIETNASSRGSPELRRWGILFAGLAIPCLLLGLAAAIVVAVLAEDTPSELPLSGATPGTVDEIFAMAHAHARAEDSSGRLVSVQGSQLDEHFGPAPGATWTFLFIGAKGIRVVIRGGEVTSLSEFPSMGFPLRSPGAFQMYREVVLAEFDKQCSGTGPLFHAKLDGGERADEFCLSRGSLQGVSMFCMKFAEDEEPFPAYTTCYAR
ncbi:MAG: serine/threonine-protein kinase [Myxococcota bacterium]